MNFSHCIFCKQNKQETISIVYNGEAKKFNSYQLNYFFDFAPTDMPTIGIVHDLDIWKKFCSEIKLKKFDG